MKKYKLGIIGLGYWGPNFARVCFENSFVELKYCCDLNKAGLLRIKQKHPSVNIIKNYDQILKDKEIKGVIVATPPATHYKIVENCLTSGKDVLVEKPITLNSSHADELLKVAKKYKRILMVDHILKFNPAIKKLKNILAKKNLGKIFYISGSYTALGPVRVDINSLWDLAPHFFYTVGYLLEKTPLWVTAFGKGYLQKKKEDVVYINLGYPGNIIANFHVSWLFPYKVRNLVLIGSKKMAVFDDTHTDQKLKVFDKGAFYDIGDPKLLSEIIKVTYREGDLVIPKIENAEPLAEVLKSFLESIRTRKINQSGGEEGRNIVRLLEAAQRSLDKGGERVSLL